MLLSTVLRSTQSTVEAIRQVDQVVREHVCITGKLSCTLRTIYIVLSLMFNASEKNNKIETPVLGS